MFETSLSEALDEFDEAVLLALAVRFGHVAALRIAGHPSHEGEDAQRYIQAVRQVVVQHLTS